MMKVAYPLGLFVCLFICISYIKWHWVSITQAFFSISKAVSWDHRGHQTRNPLGMTVCGHKVFYDTMFDVGSTGTRVHIFQFTWQPGGILPKESPSLSQGVGWTPRLRLTWELVKNAMSQ